MWELRKGVADFRILNKRRFQIFDEGLEIGARRGEGERHKEQELIIYTSLIVKIWWFSLQFRKDDWLINLIVFLFFFCFLFGSFNSPWGMTKIIITSWRNATVIVDLLGSRAWYQPTIDDITKGLFISFDRALIINHRTNQIIMIMMIIIIIETTLGYTNNKYKNPDNSQSVLKHN